MAEPMTRTTLRIPPKLWQQVRLLAVRRGTTAQALTIEALKRLLREEK